MFAVLMPVSTYIFNTGCKTTLPLPPPPPTNPLTYTPAGSNCWAVYLCCQPWGRALEITGLGIRLPHDTRGFVSVMLLFQGCAGERGGLGNWHIDALISKAWYVLFSAYFGLHSDCRRFLATCNTSTSLSPRLYSLFFL